MDKKEIQNKVKEFLKDPSKRKIELEVPKDFSMYWIKNPLGVGIRKILLTILSKVPPMHVKTGFCKMMGYDFGRDVCLPGYIDIDPYFPELIKLEPGILVGGMTQLKPWTLEDGKLTLGRIWLDRRVLTSGWARIGPGGYIHKGTICGIKCYIDEEIPENSFVIKHNKVLKTWSEEEVERFFGESIHDPNYAKKVRKLTRTYWKDKVRKVTFKNDGNRLNAGCDWWRARPIWRIYYNGLWVELQLLFPFLRKFCYRMMGLKWGKNFKLGKHVTFDHILGEKVEIGDNVTIDDDCFIDGHEYTISETMYAKVKIGNNVKIGKGSWIRCGTTIGDHAVIMPHTDVMKDIGENETWAGSPAKPVEKKE